MNFTVASSIAHQVSQAAHNTGCDSVMVLYNEFKSAIASALKRVEIQSRESFTASFKHVVRHDTEEPDKDFSQHYYYELYVTGQVYHALLQNAASE